MGLIKVIGKRGKINNLRRQKLNNLLESKCQNKLLIINGYKMELYFI
jgi:hypothetical protein